MRPPEARQVLDVCRTIAADIRAAAMQHGTDLDEQDRAGLFALAILIERKATAAVMARAAIEEAVSGLVDMLDAFDAPGEDREPSLAALEHHAGAPGADYDRELEPEHDEEGDSGIGDQDGVREQRRRFDALMRREGRP